MARICFLVFALSFFGVKAAYCEFFLFKPDTLCLNLSVGEERVHTFDSTFYLYLNHGFFCRKNGEVPLGAIRLCFLRLSESEAKKKHLGNAKLAFWLCAVDEDGRELKLREGKRLFVDVELDPPYDFGKLMLYSSEGSYLDEPSAKVGKPLISYSHPLPPLYYLESKHKVQKEEYLKCSNTWYSSYPIKGLVRTCPGSSGKNFLDDFFTYTQQEHEKDEWLKSREEEENFEQDSCLGCPERLRFILNLESQATLALMQAEIIHRLVFLNFDITLEDLDPNRIGAAEEILDLLSKAYAYKGGLRKLDLEIQKSKYASSSIAAFNMYGSLKGSEWLKEIVASAPSCMVPYHQEFFSMDMKDAVNNLKKTNSYTNEYLEDLVAIYSVAINQNAQNVSSYSGKVDAIWLGGNLYLKRRRWDYFDSAPCSFFVDQLGWTLVK